MELHRNSNGNTWDVTDSFIGQFWLKVFPTQAALIRPFYSMYSLVSNEGGRVPKKFSTFTALVRPFSSMNSLVFNECGIVPKEFPTFITLIRPRWPQDEFCFEAAAAANSTLWGLERSPTPGKPSAEARDQENTPQAWGWATDADVSNSGSWTSAVRPRPAWFLAKAPSWIAGSHFCALPLLSKTWFKTLFLL